MASLSLKMIITIAFMNNYLRMYIPKNFISKIRIIEMNTLIMEMKCHRKQNC